MNSVIRNIESTAFCNTVTVYFSRLMSKPSFRQILTSCVQFSFLHPDKGTGSLYKRVRNSDWGYLKLVIVNVWIQAACSVALRNILNIPIFKLCHHYPANFNSATVLCSCVAVAFVFQQRRRSIIDHAHAHKLLSII